MREQSYGALLYATLEAGVPLAIAQYQRTGGPSASEVEQARGFAATLGAHGDQLLYGGPEAKTLMKQLCYALAILAHSPGGITMGPCHWEVEGTQ